MQRVSLAFLVVACLAAGPVYAGTCSNPPGKEGDQLYNADYHTYQFCNGTNWIPYGGIGGGGGGGGLTLISTQTASSSASLQFTNLPTSYNTLFLNCAGLQVGTAGSYIKVLVGEGAGPSWESGANYSYRYDAVAGASGSSTTAAYLWATDTAATTTSIELQIYINNVGSSTLYKDAYIRNIDHDYSSSDIFWGYRAIGYWNNDTNALTGIEVLPSAGNIASGTCSLYGMN